jgi:hypothetical protein
MMRLTVDGPSIPHGESPGRPDARGAERLAFYSGATVLLLTSVHHVYGAILYDTPERYHAVVIAGAALALMFGLKALNTRSGSGMVRRTAWWAGWSVNAVIAVLLFGVIEGFYNHVVKVALHFGGMTEERFRWFYRDPLYELPNDVIFELTGVLQVVPAAFAGYYLVKAAVRAAGGRTIRSSIARATSAVRTPGAKSEM